MTASVGRRAGLLALTVAAGLALSLGLAEAVARVAGFEPYRTPDVRIRVEPDGVYQSGDPVLGYRHLPGAHRITFGNGVSWTATHRPDTLRITRPPEAADAGDPPEIWIFGCSFVHGWGLDDEDTFPWQLQERLPRLRVRNFGVGGYGTLQSLLQFREALARRPRPAVAVLAYAGFHDERNTRLRRWRKATFAYNRFGTTAQPFARLRRDGELRYGFDDGSYRDMALLRHSAFMTLLDEAWSGLEDRLYESHRVSEILVDEFSRTAAEHDVAFVLAGISREAGTRAMLRHSEESHVAAVDISLDLHERGLSIAWDGHPSAVATERYARKIARYLKAQGLIPP